MVGRSKPKVGKALEARRQPFQAGKCQRAGLLDRSEIDQCSSRKHTPNNKHLEQWNRTVTELCPFSAAREAISGPILARILLPPWALSGAVRSVVAIEPAASQGVLGAALEYASARLASHVNTSVS